LFSLRRQSNIKHILKTSLIILFTAKTVCILAAETVDLVFYNYSLLLSIPLALLAGTFTVVSQEAYKENKDAISASHVRAYLNSNDYANNPRRRTLGK